jgi:diguanylate cyclase (GGDEF)-like protein
MVLSMLTRKVKQMRDREQAERAETARRIEHMAYHDSLTSLPNRAHFGRRLSEMLAACREQGEPFALMLLDLDGFKKVNDVQGHQGGDLLLVEVAQRLIQSMRQGDFVARLGGDEFVVLAQLGQGVHEVDAVARRLVAAIGQPYDLDGRPATVTASIGVALCPQDGQTDDVLTHLADAAMYLAKQRGKNGVVYASAGQVAAVTTG